MAATLEVVGVRVEHMRSCVVVVVLSVCINDGWWHIYVQYAVFVFFSLPPNLTTVGLHLNITWVKRAKCIPLANSYRLSANRVTSLDFAPPAPIKMERDISFFPNQHLGIWFSLKLYY